MGYIICKAVMGVGNIQVKYTNQPMYKLAYIGHIFYQLNEVYGGGG